MSDLIAIVSEDEDKLRAALDSRSEICQKTEIRNLPVDFNKGENTNGNQT